MFFLPKIKDHLIKMKRDAFNTRYLIYVCVRAEILIQKSKKANMKDSYAHCIAFVFSLNEI